MNKTARLLAFALIFTACSTGDTQGTIGGPTETSGTDTTVGTTPGDRDCVRITGGSSPISTGSPAGDALFLAGELFVCADDVVIASDADLNGLAAGAQLAAALGGPLLLSHPQLAAELGRLKVRRIHVIGDVEVTPPPGSELSRIDITQAVDQAMLALGTAEQVRLPAQPDASTVVETVAAIAAGSRVVLPQTPPGTGTLPPPVLDLSALVDGLAVETAAESVWLVDAGDPVTILIAAATGRVVRAQVVAFDSSDVLGYPEVGKALAGRSQEALRFVGSVPETGAWELAQLINGVQLPGGGYTILGDDTPKRYVAFYGHPETAALGVLGEQGPEATLDRMAPLLDAYAADGHQVIPAFEVMASVAAAAATDDGDYSFEWPVSTFDAWIEVARANNAYVILDLQPGRDDFLSQAKLYEELLLLPFVGLALDPEWRLKPDEVHLQQIGRVDAAEVNQVVDWLADLVHDNGLPQKMLIVHQFREFMIQDRSTLKERPELQMVIQMDGQGPIDTKDTTWAVLTSGTEENHWKWGWKNFFDEDSPTPSPEHTLGKVPTPVFVSYQ
ncbi:MAG: hypothetical protein OEM32_06395 [Acidimicrobiia bacterium]|nr:hypothetical protein [Acidimicrobiia bacterium]